MIKYALLLFLWSSFGVHLSQTQNTDNQTNTKFDFSILVTNIKVKKGSIIIGIYDHSAGFLKNGKAYLLSNHPVNGNQLEVNFKNIPKGTYAISLYHDLNSDKKLSTNVLGIPTEPYGFSNNIKPKWSTPTFEECKFELKENTKIEVELVH